MSDRPDSPALAPRLMVSASGNGTEVGGVFAVGDNDCELLDPLPTTGMAVSPDGTRLARVTWVEGATDVSELVVNDSLGLLLYRRLDGVAEPHSMMWLDDEIHVVSTGNNSIATMDDSGRTKHVWRPEGVSSHGDRWHLNSLTLVGDRVLATAFGMFDAVRGWGRPGALEGAGVVFDLATGEVVLSGFSAPHDPTWLGDGWLICNSLSG